MSDKKGSMLLQRLKSSVVKSSKMDELAERSTSGSLSSFSGVFNVSPIEEKDLLPLQSLLEKYASTASDLKQDLDILSTLTSEVKAIHSQSIILHGERIQKAQRLLTNYSDGAFSAWLMHTYGNRQTPYNFLQYFEFYQTLSPVLQSKMMELPKQAIYTLSSRHGDMQKKEAIILEYNGETKKQLLNTIQDAFPLSIEDKRKSKRPKNSLKLLREVKKLINHKDFKPTVSEKQEITALLTDLVENLRKT